MEDSRNINVALVRGIVGIGGIETVMIQTAKSLKQYGFTFYIYCNIYIKNIKLEESDNIHIRTLPNMAHFEAPENRDVLLQKLKEDNIDLVCFDYFTKGITDEIKRATSCKMMYWMHSKPLYYIDEKRVLAIHKVNRNPYKIFRYFPFNIVVKLALRHVEINDRKRMRLCFEMSDIVSVLVPQYKYEVKKILGLTANEGNKLKVLVNNVDINQTPILSKSKKVVYIGRFDNISKRVNRLIEVWNKIEKDLPDWTLELYGYGEQEQELRDLIEKYKLKRCHIMGKRDNVQPIYDEASIVCLTSEYEGLPMTLLEAQNNGCIPMAFDCVGGIKFVIGEDKEYGRIVKSYDLDEYAQKLKELCLDEQLRTKISTRVLQKRLDYEFKHNIPIWLEIKEKVLNNK